jgi:thymidylate kinase
VQRECVNRNTFLLPLFAAGAKIIEPKVLEALRECDVVLKNRTFISSLAYNPASGGLGARQVWDLFVGHMGITVPDVSVIVDAEVEVAAARIAKRPVRDIGLGGKMSGDLEHRRKIRENFLKIPHLFPEELNAIVVENNGRPTKDEAVLRASIEKVGLEIVGFCEGRGGL